MIFYFEVTLDDFDGGTKPEKGIVMASDYGGAAKQIEELMFDYLLSIDKLEAIDARAVLYLTNNPLREPLIQSIKERAAR